MASIKTIPSNKSLSKQAFSLSSIKGSSSCAYFYEKVVTRMTAEVCWDPTQTCFLWWLVCIYLHTANCIEVFNVSVCQEVCVGQLGPCVLQGPWYTIAEVCLVSIIKFRTCNGYKPEKDKLRNLSITSYWLTSHLVCCFEYEMQVTKQLLFWGFTLWYLADHSFDMWDKHFLKRSQCEPVYHLGKFCQMMSST